DVTEQGADEDRREHADGLAAVRRRQHFRRDEFNQREGDRNAARDDPEKIHDPRPDDSRGRFQRIGVDYRGDSVGGVVKSIREFEAQNEGKARNQKADSDRRSYGQGGQHRHFSCGDIAEPSTGCQEGSDRRPFVGDQETSFGSFHVGSGSKVSSTRLTWKPRGNTGPPSSSATGKSEINPACSAWRHASSSVGLGSPIRWSR